MSSCLRTSNNGNTTALQPEEHQRLTGEWKGLTTVILRRSSYSFDERVVVRKGGREEGRKGGGMDEAEV